MAKSHTIKIGGSKVKLSRSESQIAVRPHVGMAQSMQNAIRSIAVDTPVERRGRLAGFDIVHIQASPKEISRARTNLRAAASVHQEHHQETVTNFVFAHHELLNTKPSALISVSLSAALEDQKAEAQKVRGSLRLCSGVATTHDPPSRGCFALHQVRLLSGAVRQIRRHEERLSEPRARSRIH